MSEGRDCRQKTLSVLVSITPSPSPRCLGVGEWVDAIIILMIVLLNATIGVIQESKAEKAIEALEKMTTPLSFVRRDGEVREINSENLVVGDIVILDAGRYVPADLRLIDRPAFAC